MKLMKGANICISIRIELRVKTGGFNDKFRLEFPKSKSKSGKSWCVMAQLRCA